MGNERAYGSGTPGAVGSPLAHLRCQCWQTTSPIPQPKVYHSHRHFPEQSWHHRCKCLFENQSKQDAVPFQKGNQTMQQQGKKKVYVILHWWVVSCWVWKCPSSWCSRTHFASNRLLKKRSKVSLGNLCSRTFMTTHVLRHLFLCIYIYTHAYAYGQMVNAANQEPTYDFIAVGVEDYGGSLFVLNIRF